MQTTQRPTRQFVPLILAYCLWWSLISVAAADANTPNPPVPAIIQTGFAEWTRGGASASLTVWNKGGLMEGDRKVVAEANYFKRMDPAIGGFKGFDVVQTQGISSSSELVYVAINFQRAVIYGRFLLYRTDQDWVVQNMDFNAKPEALVPWLALPGVAATE